MTMQRIEQEEDVESIPNEQMMGDDEEKPKQQQQQRNAAISFLSKSWSVSSAHVPTFSGGKISHCHTKYGLPTHEEGSDYLPFLLFPVSGDLAIVDSQRGVKIRTIRQGAQGQVVDGNEDDDDDDGVDADAIGCYALSWNDQILLTVSQNQLIRQYSLTSVWDVDKPAPVQKVWGRSGHSLPVTHMEFHVSNVFCATGSVDGTVRVWDVRGSFVTHVFRPMRGGGGGGGDDENYSSGMHSVTCVAWKQDVTKLILAIGRSDGSIVIHDLRDQDDIVVLRDHVSAVTCLGWGTESSMDSFFVSAGRDAVLNTWSIVKKEANNNTRQKKKKKKRSAGPKHTYKRLRTIPIYEQVEGLCILPARLVPGADLLVATAGSKGSVRLWKASKEGDFGSVTDFSCALQQAEQDAFGEAKGGYTGMLYNPRGEEDAFYGQGNLIVADAEHNLSFLSLLDSSENSLSAVRTIVGYNDEILDLKVIPDAMPSHEAPTRIVVSTNSAQIRVFELGNFSCDILDGHTATVLCVDVSPCGRLIASCGKDKTVRIWDVSTYQCVATGTGHTEAIGATALSRKVGRYEVGGKAAQNGAGSFVVTASKDRTLKRWNLPGTNDLDGGGTSQVLELKTFCSGRAHEKDINIVSVAPNDSLVATGSQDKTAKIWRASDLSLQATLKGHKRGVWDCQFSPHDRVIVTSSADRSIKLWSLNDYSCVRTFQGHTASVLRVRFLSGGLQLVSSGADGLIKLWTIRTNECEATMDGHFDKVWALDLSPDGRKLVSGGADSRITVWEDTTKEEESKRQDEEEQNILMEQRLANHVRSKEFGKALNLALELDRPRQTLQVLTSIVEEEIQRRNGTGLAGLQSHVKLWSMEQTTKVLRYCRDWNTRARNSGMAMLVLQAIVTTIPAAKLASTREIPEILAGITPYAERHFDRLDRLYESSFLVDFTLFSMGHIEIMDDEEESADSSELAYTKWVARSKHLSVVKATDGRIQIGGSTTVERLQIRGESSDEEVVTLGESDSSSFSESEEDEDEE